MYLDDTEKENGVTLSAACYNNVKEGGYWITADIYVKRMPLPRK